MVLPVRSRRRSFRHGQAGGHRVPGPVAVRPRPGGADRLLSRVVTADAGGLAATAGALAEAPDSWTSLAALGEIEAGLAANGPAAAAGELLAGRAGGLLVTRHAQTGTWFPEAVAPDRYRLSALWGLGAVCHAFTRLAAPAPIPSIRLIAPCARSGGAARTAAPAAPPVALPLVTKLGGQLLDLDHEGRGQPDRRGQAVPLRAPDPVRHWVSNELGVVAVARAGRALLGEHAALGVQHLRDRLRLVADLEPARNAREFPPGMCQHVFAAHPEHAARADTAAELQRVAVRHQPRGCARDPLLSGHLGWQVGGQALPAA